MSDSKTYFVLRAAIHRGALYLKCGDPVPPEVPAETVAAWIAAKSIGEKAPVDPKKKKE